jgi:hypothetical protein
MSLGDFDTSSVVYFKFTTFRPSTGAPFTLAGTPALSVYKDNSTTQSTTGVTLTVDFDGVTGLNHVAVDTSDAFYSAGSFFDVVITTGTVDSVSAVGVVVGRFTLRKTACLKPTTSGRTLDVSSGGEAGIDLANVGSPTTTLNLSGTTISTSQVVASVTGAVGSVTGSVGSVTGAVGSVTGNVGGNVVGSVASVTARVTANTDQLAGQTVTAANAVTFPSIVSSLTAAGVRSELAVELGRIDVDVSTRLASSSYTTPPTAASNATAVWNSLLSSHTTAGTFGGRIPRSDSSNVEVKITGSAHIAADIHELQPAVIEAQHFATGAIDANALATDAATEIATAVYTGQMTESYRAAGVAPTLAQAMFELVAQVGDSFITDTTKTIRKIDGTTAKTFTLDSATTPTSITEAT